MITMQAAAGPPEAADNFAAHYHCTMTEQGKMDLSWQARVNAIKGTLPRAARPGLGRILALCYSPSALYQIP